MKTRSCCCLLCAALALIALGGCKLDLDRWYGQLSYESEASLAAADGLIHPLVLGASRRVYGEDPPPLTDTLALTGRLDRPTSGWSATVADLWLRLDRSLEDGAATYTATQAMLRLSGPRPEQVALPAPGWTLQGQVVVNDDQERSVPPEDERPCQAHVKRELRGTLSLEITGPEGRTYRISGAPLTVRQGYTCEAFTM